MAAIGHPIEANPLYHPCPKPNRMLLHAHQLEFNHPHLKYNLCITAPLPFEKGWALEFQLFY